MTIAEELLDTIRAVLLGAVGAAAHPAHDGDRVVQGGGTTLRRPRQPPPAAAPPGNRIAAHLAFVPVIP